MIQIRIAALLMLATIFAHIIGGATDVYRPLLASPLTIPLKAYVSILWHAVTVVLICFTVALVWLSYRPNPPLAILVAAIQLGFTGLFIYYGLTDLGTIWPMPQWIVFSLVPALTLWGQFKALKPANAKG